MMATRNGNGKYSKPPADSTSEQTGNQSPANGRITFMPPQMEMIQSMLSGKLPSMYGGYAENPMGFPGYGRLYTGRPETYRWMLQHPVLRLVRSICIGIITANEWDYEKVTKDAKDDWVEFTQQTFDQIRFNLIWDFFVRGRDMGFASGEPIWEPGNGLLNLTRVKPLTPENTECLEDKHGNFLGLRNNIAVDNKIPELSAPYKAWLYTYDGENGYKYGRSWLENARATGWTMWLNCAQELRRLGNKISGTVGIIFSPAGTFPGPLDANGNQTQVSYEQNAHIVLNALAGGAIGAWFPSLGLTPDSKGNIDAMKVLVELAGKSLTHFEKFDFTGQTAAIGPILDEMKHAEELMFNAGLRSARTGLESQGGGTKAEAGEHIDLGTVNAEGEEESFARQCQPLVDANLALNKTPNAVGKVRIKPRSLIDRKTSIYKASFLALLNDPVIAKEVGKTPGLIKSMMKVLDIASDSDFSVEELKKSIEASLKAKQKPGPNGDKTTQPEPQGGRPPQG